LRLLKTYARKAERDFLRFMSKVDYTDDIAHEDGAIVPLSTLFNHEDEQVSESPINTETALVQVSKEENETPEAALTYHPLLPDALFSLLLAQTISLTPPQLSPTSPTTLLTLLREKEKADLKRWAYEAARLQAICDGYPLFLPARSPYSPPFPC
jgi:hypothetical protein